MTVLRTVRAANDRSAQFARESNPLGNAIPLKDSQLDCLFCFCKAFSHFRKTAADKAQHLIPDVNMPYSLVMIISTVLCACEAYRWKAK